MSGISVRIKGLDKLRAALKGAPDELKKAMQPAAEEIGHEILGTEGLQKYPPAGDANNPPTPYYIRGRGTQYAGGNANNSERYGTQFYVESAEYKTTIGNRASYAPYLAGEDTQASFMGAKGWRKLIEVAREKIEDIARIYGGWVARKLKELGL